MTEGFPRRDFLRAAGVTLGVVAAGGRSALGSLAPRARRPAKGPQGRLLETQPSDCPIDTVVVLMMENRSFDHYLGWLGEDHDYLERGKSRYGSKFTVDGRIDQTFVDAVAKQHKTHHLTRGGAIPIPSSGTTPRSRSAPTAPSARPACPPQRHRCPRASTPIPSWWRRSSTSSWPGTTRWPPTRPGSTPNTEIL